MTKVRSKRSKWIHATVDARNPLCGVRLKQMIVEPDAEITCPKCHEITTTN